MAGILPFGVVFIELFFVLTVSYEWFYLGSITPELRIMTSQTELLTLKFYLLKFFELVT